jgi:hypothetical protein
VGNGRFIKTFVAQNCLKIMGDIGKHACLTDGFVHAQLLKFCRNTRTQFISANINIPDSDSVITVQHKHVDRKIAYEILQKGTRGSFRKWPQQDIDLAITMLQMPQSMGGFGMAPNVIAQYPPKWPWPLVSLALLALCHLRNNSYGSQTKMCKTLSLGFCLT